MQNGCGRLDQVASKAKAPERDARPARASTPATKSPTAGRGGAGGRSRVAPAAAAPGARVRQTLPHSSQVCVARSPYSTRFYLNVWASLNGSPVAKLRLRRPRSRSISLTTAVLCAGTRLGFSSRHPHAVVARRAAGRARRRPSSPAVPAPARAAAGRRRR